MEVEDVRELAGASDYNMVAYFVGVSFNTKHMTIVFVKQAVRQMSFLTNI